MIFLKTHSDSGEQTFGHVSDNNTDQEDDSIKPIVAEDEGNDEERHTEEHSHSSDDVDEMSNLLSNGGVT